MTQVQYVGQHYVVTRHGRHRAAALPRIAGPALLAASGALAAAAVATAAFGGSHSADGSVQSSHDDPRLSAQASDNGRESSAHGSTGDVGQRFATAAAQSTSEVFDGNSPLASAIPQRTGVSRTSCSGCPTAVSPSPGDAPGPSLLDAALNATSPSSLAPMSVPRAAGQTADRVAEPMPPAGSAPVQQRETQRDATPTSPPSAPAPRVAAPPPPAGSARATRPDAASTERHADTSSSATPASPVRPAPETATGRHRADPAADSDAERGTGRHRADPLSPEPPRGAGHAGSVGGARSGAE